MRAPARGWTWPLRREVEAQVAVRGAVHGDHPGALLRLAVGADTRHPAVGFDDERGLAGCGVHGPGRITQRSRPEPGRLAPDGDANGFSDAEQGADGLHAQVLGPPEPHEIASA